MTVAICGIGVTGGVNTAIGKAMLLAGDEPYIEPSVIPANAVEQEVKRFRRAVAKAVQQLHDLRHQIPASTPADILEFIDTHLLMLEDKAISEAPVHSIREEGYSAEWALQLRRNQLIKVFDEMEDPYLRSRKDDVDHVVNRIQNILLGRSEIRLLELDSHIVVARDLTPADIILLHNQGVRGLITEFGSPMSHTAILARSLGIPTIMGAHNVTRHIHDHETLVIDAENGVALVECDDQCIRFFQRRLEAEETHKRSLKPLSQTVAQTRDGHQLQLLANIELPEDVRSAAETGAQGIGLYRTEFLYMNRPTLPSEEDHFQAYLQVVTGMPDALVTIRTMDLGADKQCEYYPQSIASSNPALGLRAIRLCLKEIEIFRIQIRAILRVSCFGQVRLMIPMLTNLWEAHHARALIDDEIHNLQRAGVAVDQNIPIGAMIETPAAAMTAAGFARVFDFLSIGTNDLIQYTLAVDRADDSVAHLYDPLHPAILLLIKGIIDAADRSGTQLGMCGEMAGDPNYIPLLIGMGLIELSMHPASLLEAKQLIQQLDYLQLKQQVHSLMQQTDSLGMEQRVRQLGKNQDLMFNLPNCSILRGHNPSAPSTLFGDSPFRSDARWIT